MLKGALLYHEDSKANGKDKGGAESTWDRDDFLKPLMFTPQKFKVDKDKSQKIHQLLSEESTRSQPYSLDEIIEA